MNLKEVFKDFNPNKFVLFVCLLPLTILVSIKLNGNIDWSLWIVFIPLWIFNFIMIVGATVGVVIFCLHPEYRVEHDGYTDFKAMLITVGLQLLLLAFELLLCYNIENQGVRNSWILVFAPLFFASPMAIAACIWGFRNSRSLELELVLSVNILLFIFVALRLDNIILWPWTVVFIPLWIVMCLPCSTALYYFIQTLIFFRSTFPESVRRTNLIMAIAWIFVVIPLLTFQVLLSHKLDGMNNNSWASIFVPLHICFLALIVGTFGSKEGSKWWFGIRTDFFQFIIEACPCVRLYGNISYKCPAKSERSRPVTPGLHPTNSHIYGVSEKHMPRDIYATSSEKSDCAVQVMSVDSPD